MTATARSSLKRAAASMLQSSPRSRGTGSPSLTPRDRIIRFVWVGVINTAFGYGVYAGTVFFGAHPQVALVLQFCLGVLWNFTTHARLVFEVTGTRKLPLYAGAYGLVYGANALLLALLIGMGLDPYLAQAIAMPPVVVLSYLLVSAALGVPLRSEGMAR